MKNLFWIIGLTLFISCTNDDNEVTQQQVQKEKYSLDVSLNPSSSGTLNISSGEYEEGTEVEIIVTPNSGFEFKDWTGDGSGNQNPFKLIMNSDKNIVGNLNELQIQSIEVTNPIDTLVISNIHKFDVNGIYSNGNKIDLSELVEIEKLNDKITILDDNQFTVGKSGETSLRLKYGEFELIEDFYSYEIEYQEIDNKFLSYDNCSLRVPVVIINYFPTNDGIIHNDTIGPSSYWKLNNPPLNVTKTKVREDLILTKNLIQYGTRFRDYGSGEIDPFVCIDVLEYINIYEVEFLEWLTNKKKINYKKIFEKINLEHYVNNLGVKEVWFTSFPKGSFPSIVNSGLDDESTYHGQPESNMSSPLTGDISNSYRDQEDLPIYNKTYVVYGNSGHRGVDTNLHNRGHQIEVQMKNLESLGVFGELRPNSLLKGEILWDDFFIGKNGENRPIKNGRSGNTHFPPNGEDDYDYGNENFVESDIKKWTPLGGPKELINYKTWTDINYPVDMIVHNEEGREIDNSTSKHMMWMLFWFQSIPGENNNIPYERNGNSYKLTNWWELFYNWDQSIQNNKTLWE